MLYLGYFCPLIRIINTIIQVNHFRAENELVGGNLVPISKPITFTQNLTEGLLMSGLKKWEIFKED